MFQLCYNENFQLCILDTGAVIETYSTLSMSPLWLKWLSGSTKYENTKFQINTDNSVRQLTKVTLYLSIHVNLKDYHKIPTVSVGFPSITILNTHL